MPTSPRAMQLLGVVVLTVGRQAATEVVTHVDVTVRLAGTH